MEPTTQSAGNPMMKSIGMLVAGLVLGAAGGYYYGAMKAPATAQAVQTTGTSAAANPYADIQTNPYDSVKTNPFQ